VKSTDRLFSMAKWLGIVVILLFVWLVYEMVNDPYEDMREAGPPEADPGEGTAVSGQAEGSTGLDYEGIQENIEGAQRLWEPLVKKPKPPPKKISMEEKVKGLKVVAAVSEGDEVKFIIRDAKDNTEKLYKKGGKVRDLTLSSFTLTHVILSFGGESIKMPI